jgi:hypothetical protein
MLSSNNKMQDSIKWKYIGEDIYTISQLNSQDFPKDNNSNIFIDGPGLGTLKSGDENFFTTNYLLREDPGSYIYFVVQWYTDKSKISSWTNSQWISLPSK